MKSSRGWVGVAKVLSGVATVLLLLVIVGALIAGIPQNAAGMAAKGICSAALVAGRPLTTLLADDVLPASPVLRLISIEVDSARQSVTGRFVGLFARTAVPLPDRGCVLDLPAAPVPAASPPVAPSEAPWPGGDAPIAIEQWSDAAAENRMKQVVDGAFAGAGDPLGANPRGVAVVQHGRLLALRLAPGFDPSTPLHGWSMTKTVNAMLAYKRAAESGLALDTPVVDAFAPGRAPAWTAAWRADVRRDIKVSDLFYMRDGLANVEDYNPWGTVPEMLWGEPDAAAYAAASPAEAAPGKRWRYLSATANILSAVARGRFGGDAEYWAYPAQALFAPIGARTAFMETDTAGNWVGSSYLWASVGDWARLGQLLLDDGRWGERQVLPPGFLALAKTPAMPEGAGRGYGAQAWLLGDPVGGGCRGQGLPADIVAMSGHWGQVLAVVPSRGAVIVRLGWTFRRSQFDACRFIGEVLQALPR